jgi:hypothetical protein
VFRPPAPLKQAVTAEWRRPVLPDWREFQALKVPAAGTRRRWCAGMPSGGVTRAADALPLAVSLGERPDPAAAAPRSQYQIRGTPALQGADQSLDRWRPSWAPEVSNPGSSASALASRRCCPKLQATLRIAAMTATGPGQDRRQSPVPRPRPPAQSGNAAAALPLQPGSRLGRRGPGALRPERADPLAPEGGGAAHRRPCSAVKPVSLN